MNEDVKVFTNYEYFIGDKYMYKLPVVKPEICGSLDYETSMMSDEKYIKKQIDRIAVENPTIAEWISRFSKETKDPKNAAMCAIITYKLLESQAEVNMMEAEFNLA